MSATVARVLAHIDDHRDDVIGFLQSLIRLQPAGETAIQETVSSQMRAAGYAGTARGPRPPCARSA